ncbi:MAG: type IVB secretion system protein IcmH/DotU [Pseudomonadota bacterium]
MTTNSIISDHTILCLYPDNPLMECARPVLYQLYQLRSNTINDGAINDKTSLIKKLDQFVNTAAQQKLSEEQTKQAHYLFCVVADEFYYRAIGKTSAPTFSLSGKFHQDTQGGEKFFATINHLCDYPESNSALLELAYVLLGLGYEGKYALMPNRHQELTKQSQTLYACVKKSKRAESSSDKQISADQNNLTKKQKSIYLGVTIFAVAFLCYATFAIILNHKVNNVHQTIHTLVSAQTPFKPDNEKSN